MISCLNKNQDPAVGFYFTFIFASLKFYSNSVLIKMIINCVTKI